MPSDEYEYTRTLFHDPQHLDVQRLVAGMITSQPFLSSIVTGTLSMPEPRDITTDIPLPDGTVAQLTINELSVVTDAAGKANKTFHQLTENGIQTERATGIAFQHFSQDLVTMWPPQEPPKNIPPRFT